MRLHCLVYLTPKHGRCLHAFFKGRFDASSESSERCRVLPTSNYISPKANSRVLDVVQHLLGFDFRGPAGWASSICARCLSDISSHLRRMLATWSARPYTRRKPFVNS